MASHPSVFILHDFSLQFDFCSHNFIDITFANVLNYLNDGNILLFIWITSVVHFIPPFDSFNFYWVSIKVQTLLLVLGIQQWTRQANILLHGAELLSEHLIW